MDGISIIIPVYNEERVLEKNARRLIEYLKKLKLKFEIIIADNGSTDNTSSIARKISRIYSNVKYIRIDKRGPGEAFKVAIKKAKYKKIIQLDADLTIDYKSFIRRSIDLLDSYEMVIGSKLLKQRRQLYRKILSLSFIILSKILFNLPYSDYSIGAKSYRKDFLLKNIEIIDRWTFYPFKLAYFAKRVKEISIYCFDKRKSKFNLFYEVFYKFYNIIKFRMEVNKK
jgi:glycosyltransferase involved in cell wall biosynthesis